MIDRDALRETLRSLTRYTAGIDHGPCIDADAMEAVFAALAARPPTLDVERLAEALHAERELFFGYTAPCEDNLCVCRLIAPTVAAEYARLSEMIEP